MERCRGALTLAEALGSKIVTDKSDRVNFWLPVIEPEDKLGFHSATRPSTQLTSHFWRS
jgi:hypothetical protein